MAIYLHFTCSSRRNSILKNGLIPRSSPNIDETVNEYLYFVRYNVFKDIYDPHNNKAVDVICFLLTTCKDKKIDIWGVLDDDNKYNIHESRIKYEYITNKAINKDDLLFIETTTLDNLNYYINTEDGHKDCDLRYSI